MKKTKVSGNTILITGGSSGIGFELAKVLTSMGNKLIVCGRSMEKLEKARNALPSLHIVQCDLSEQAECEKLFAWISKHHPDCNMLINNAAYANRMTISSDANYVEKAIHELQTNLIAPITLTKLFLPLLKKNANSTIINVTTGLVYLPKAVQPIYCASKAALHSFTQTLRLQLKDTSIKIIEVLPPAVDTPFHQGNVPKIAISVVQTVREMIAGLEKNKSVIHVAGSKMVYALMRIAPAFGLKKINEL